MNKYMICKNGKNWALWYITHQVNLDYYGEVKLTQDGPCDIKGSCTYQKNMFSDDWIDISTEKAEYMIKQFKLENL